jgi:GDP-L-fucose synthase
VNVGSGTDVSIAELAKMVMRVVGLDGEVICDPSKPDGTPRKLMDGSVLRGLGWRPSIALEDGLARVYAEGPLRAAA